MQLWTQGELKWAREESLTRLVVAEFVELPEQAVSESEDGTGKGFFARIIRQLFDAQVGILNSYQANPHTYGITGPSTLSSQLCKKIRDGLICLYTFCSVISFIIEEFKFH